MNREILKKWVERFQSEFFEAGPPFDDLRVRGALQENRSVVFTVSPTDDFPEFLKTFIDRSHIFAELDRSSIFMVGHWTFLIKSLNPEVWKDQAMKQDFQRVIRIRLGAYDPTDSFVQ